jgi:hypothetical protein
MNAAVAAPIDRTQRRTRIVLAVAATLTMSAALYAMERGPFSCDNGCLAQSPTIDARSQAFLENLITRDAMPFLMFTQGATYTICSATQCANYKMKADGTIVGERRPAPSPRGGGGSGSGGGGGGGGGGGYSGPISSGSYGGGGGGGTGTVTVGPSGPLPKLPKGSQEI